MGRSIYQRLPASNRRRSRRAEDSRAAAIESFAWPLLAGSTFADPSASPVKAVQERPTHFVPRNSECSGFRHAVITPGAFSTRRCPVSNDLSSSESASSGDSSQRCSCGNPLAVRIPDTAATRAPPATPLRRSDPGRSECVVAQSRFQNRTRDCRTRTRASRTRDRSETTCRRVANADSQARIVVQTILERQRAKESGVVLRKRQLHGLDAEPSSGQRLAHAVEND